MRGYRYQIRVFRCPECKNQMYAPKGMRKMTKPGHKKSLWCPWCKEIKNFMQIE